MAVSATRSYWTTNRWLNISICLCFIILPAHVVVGWGKEGHDIVANLAYARLSSESQTIVKNILRQSDGSYGEDDKAGSPLASVANWADHLRSIHAFHWSAPLHYIDIQDQTIDGGCPCSNETTTTTSPCRFEYDRDCVDDICVAGAIMNFTHQLSHWSVQKEYGKEKQPLFLLRGSQKKEIREALMFLVHFVGDIHQPLHSARASDRGGNAFHVHFHPSLPSTRVALSGSELHPHHDGLSLHAIWDSAIIERAIQEYFSGSREEMEKHLTALILNSTETESWLTCADGLSQDCVTDWAEESFKDALEWAYRNVDDSEVVDGSILDDLYYQTRLVVVQTRLAAAGVRLAATLHTVLGKQQPMLTEFFSQEGGV